jgi:uncharacterized membrane protein YidH (DUF202 family)
MSEVPEAVAATGDHLSWVRTRLTLERDLRDAVARGIALITTGFGSFAIVDGLATNRDRESLPKLFALAATAVGVVLILLGIEHYRRMTAWVDNDAFADTAKLDLPDEQRPMLTAIGAAVVGVVSFVALLLTR